MTATYQPTQSRLSRGKRVVIQMLRKQRRHVKLCQRSARTSARLPRFMQRTIDWGTPENLPQCMRWRFERIVADEWITQAWERIKQTFPQTPPILLEVVTHHQRMGQPSSSSSSFLFGTLVCGDPPATPIPSNCTMMEKMKETRKTKSKTAD